MVKATKKIKSSPKSKAKIPSKKSARIQNKIDSPSKAPIKPNSASKTKSIKKPAKVAVKPLPKKTAKTTTKPQKKKCTPAASPQATTEPKIVSNPEPKVKKAAPPKVPKDNTPKGYTKDQFEKYKSQVKRLSSFGNNELKQMLKKNLQSMSGNKDQLVAKIADGIVLGRIPRCPSCFGGRPKYDYKTGTYHCSGYRDDQQFKNCHKDYTKEELKRDPWQ